MQILVTILVLALVIGLYIGSYLMNKRTPVPEGIISPEGCATCGTTSCGHHPGQKPDKIEEQLSHKHDYDVEI